MPELPSVETFRQVAETALDRRIDTIDLRDPDCLRGAAAADLERAAKGQELTVARRHGKVLFLRFGKGRWLSLHFGMTGRLVLMDDPDAPWPEHARLALGFADGARLVFDNQRKFGWAEPVDDPDDWLADNGIGPDALTIDAETFAQRIGNGRGMVKPALMDQEKLAGLGNVWSDEVLFQQGIAPHAPRKALSADDLNGMHATMVAVLREAIDRGAQVERMPRDWLVRHRGDDGRCPRCDGPIARREVGGRAARWCPECQTIPEHD